MLKDRLQAMMRGTDGWYRELAERLARRLQVAAREGALRAGDPMPDFVLPDSAGSLVFSDALLARGPLVVTFYRGGWCPWCRTTLQALEQALPDIRAAGASLVALSPDTGGRAAETRRDLSLSYDLLTDTDSTIALRFGTVFHVPDEYRAAVLFYGNDLRLFQGDGPGLLPMPATFLAGRDGVLRFAHASGDITDRTDPEQIVALLRSLRAEEAPDGKS